VNIALVDDDTALRALIRDFLVGEEFTVFEADSGEALRQILAATEIDIIVLDVMMPGEDGLSIAHSLIENNDVGIIMVSARGAEADRIVGLEVGADDYLAKPISPRELLARIKALQRRRRARPAHAAGSFTYHFAGWRLDPVRRILFDPQGSITILSEGEFNLLLAMVERPQQVLTRDQLLDISRGAHSDSFDRAIDSQISRLRRKLGGGVALDIIRTVRNGGYIFAPEVRCVEA
jgi:two-component system OmpR family response regulator